MRNLCRTRSDWCIVDAFLLEGTASAILRAGGQDDDEPPALAALARAFLGPNGVTIVPTLRTPGEVYRIHGEWRIALKAGLPLERKAFVLAHELAEWWLATRERYVGEDVEDAANYVAAAILTPPRAFTRAIRRHGRDFSALARAFRVTETHAALREAEVHDLPRAVLAPVRVRVRGSVQWPPEEEIRRLARTGGPGIVSARLRDDPRRLVLDVQAALK